MRSEAVGESRRWRPSAVDGGGGGGMREDIAFVFLGGVWGIGERIGMGNDD
jgi:hypothetical protein